MNPYEMDKIYKNVPLEKIPWNNEAPPVPLIELISGGTIKPCKVIDLGCGVGHYASYLAKLGFDVTGVDYSITAITHAKEQLGERARVKFQTADILGNLNHITDTFDFAYDWEVLHHIFPEHREKYLRNVSKLLNSNGKYLSVCFSEKDQQFGGTGKYRKTKLGTVLYFSSEEELNILFASFFNIKELKTIEIRGKSAPHMAVYALLEKKP